ncbi:exodeoxyribonuclease V subunit gamma [Propionivibrio limicola]|uniref:exodeoxyribonuclease V subunit gamma n=1 Tax=Propionivibrio limicola TaxID=167645 RepID=UPI001B862BAC|nr:exodeoxyribonuclease V subunit gamma [Propionivibrio limicola]
MTEHALAPGFMVIHGNQPELLRQLLVHWYKAHPLTPLEDEIVLVQSNGIAQWLKLALAANASAAVDSGCGIAASLDMLLPSRFIWQVYRAVLGGDAVPEASPFDKPLLLWRLMRLLPNLIGQPGYEPLARFLQDDGDLRKRYQLAEKIADLFDQYQVYRADWLDAWANRHDVLLNGRGESRPLDPAQCWQAMLWRALLEDVGEAAQTSRAAVHQRFLSAASALQEHPHGLPRRVSVFGLSSLPKQSLEVLLAISRFTQVLLCVHNPCEHYWANLLSEKDLARRTSERHSRKKGTPEIMEESDLHLHAHPLLASWGKQGRDYIALLDELDAPDSYRSLFAEVGERIDVFESHGGATLLNQLQDDIRLLRSAHESRETWPAVDPASDHSIRFHVAHSAQREMEILHDQLLAAFDADETLRPRDVIVMVPDVNEYAPHIEAVFGQIDTSDRRYIPFSIADQIRRHQAPIAFALEFLLGVPESRLAVSDILDLLDVPAVRQRLGIEADDLPLLHQWIDQTRIRWGLDGQHREQFIQQRYEQNTWMHGLKRMLLGYAVGSDPTGREDDDWHDIEPHGEVSGLDAALVGPLSRLLIQLEQLVRTFATPATPEAWNDRLQQLLQDFFLSDAPEDTLLLRKLQSSLQYWVEACAAAGLHDEIPLAVIREHWLSQIDEASLAQRFMAGKLTFATLMPMRAIPFKMVCLLGMNDGEFPRSRPPVDFDLMARDIRPGDRSRRDDDRYLFLEALLSARERLHISWVGRSIQDNTERPPSVLVSQLRDHLEACWRVAAADSQQKLLPALTVEHRLQAFSQDYFRQDTAASPLFTYAREWERKASADTPPVAAETPLAAPVFDAPITLGQLGGFLKDPVKTFYRERLRVAYEIDDLTSEDNEPFDLDGLERWALQDQLIQARLDALLASRDEADAVQRQLARIRRRGELPLGEMADLFEGVLLEPLDEMFALYEETQASWPTPLEDLSFDYSYEADGQPLTVQGRIGQFFGAGENCCRIELNTSNFIEKNKYRREKLLSAWVLHLASHLADRPITTFIVSKNGLVAINPLDPEAAKKHFHALVESYVAGLRSPLPLAPKTGFAWLEKQGTPFEGALADCQQKAVKNAREKYEDGYNYQGECSQNDYLKRCYPTFEAFWSTGQFTHYCEVLYAPLMACVGKNSESE